MHYLTTSAAAELYGVSEQAVRKWCRAGKLACVRVGKLWRVAVDDAKEKAAQAVECDAANDEVLISSTLKGHYTWQR